MRITVTVTVRSGDDLVGSARGAVIARGEDLLEIVHDVFDESLLTAMKRLRGVTPDAPVRSVNS